MFKLATSLFLIGALSACGTDDLAADGSEIDTNGDLARVVSADRSDDVAARPAPLPAQCSGLQDVAATLLGAYQQCSRDADCGTEWVQASCLGSFLCPVTVNVGTDLARLEREASALSFAYTRACTSNCPVASCAAPQRSYCDTQTKRCKSSFQ